MGQPEGTQIIELTTNNKQLLDEVEHDIMNYQNRGLCYLPKPKADIMRKANSIIVLLYIFETIGKRRHSSVEKWLWHGSHLAKFCKNLFTLR